MKELTIEEIQQYNNQQFNKVIDTFNKRFQELIEDAKREFENGREKDQPMKEYRIQSRSFNEADGFFDWSTVISATSEDEALRSFHLTYPRSSFRIIGKPTIKEVQPKEEYIIKWTPYNEPDGFGTPILVSATGDYDKAIDALLEAYPKEKYRKFASAEIIHGPYKKEYLIEWSLFPDTEWFPTIISATSKEEALKKFGVALRTIQKVTCITEPPKKLTT